LMSKYFVEAVVSTACRTNHAVDTTALVRASPLR
jgi:hypothetical protein